MSAATSPGGEINTESLYTLEEIQARLGLGIAAMRQLRRRGLPVKYLGRRGYVSGRDFMSFFNDSAKTEK